MRAQRYDGGFDADERSGEGTLVDSEGEALYSGEWRRDRRDGRGVGRTAHGDLWDGDWASELPHGRGVMTCANGPQADGAPSSRTLATA